jgi:hypothetical protein
VLKEIAGAPAIPAPGLHHFLTPSQFILGRRRPPCPRGSGWNWRQRSQKLGDGRLHRDLVRAPNGRDSDEFKRTARRVAAHLSKLIFHMMLKKRAYTKDSLAQLVSASRFRQSKHQQSQSGFELWLHK